MALASRRLAAVVVGAMMATVSSLAGQIGVASAADPITTAPAPTLTAPADDPTGAVPIKDLVLKWTAVPHADKYEVQISPNRDWTNNTVTLPNGGMTVNTVYDVPISLPHSFYYWHVRAFHGKAHTAWSSNRTFLREWFAPFNMLHVPTTTDPTLSWEPVAGASLYRIRFSDQPDFSQNNHICYTAQTTFTPYKLVSTNPEKMTGSCFDVGDLVDGTTYYWELIAYDDTSAAAIVADTANDPSFECAQTQPECDAFFPHASSSSPSFTFQAPSAGTVATNAVPTGLTTTWHNSAGVSTDCTTSDCPITPTFSWNPVPGANFYEVHIWHDPAHLNTYKVYDTAYPTLTPRDDFFDDQAGSGYFWSVSAGTCQNPGQTDCAASSAAASSCPTTTTASSPTIASDASGLSASPAGPQGPQSIAAGKTASITLTGTGFAGACVTASSAGGVIKNTTTVDSTHVKFDYTAPGTPGSVTFTVTNGDGGTSNASPALAVAGTAGTVTHGPLSPSARLSKRSGPVDLVSPADGAHTHASSVTFMWDSFLTSGARGSYDVRNYHLQVATDSSFDHVVWDNADIDMTQFTNPAALLPDGKYFWRVQGIDESGNPLTWSRGWSFTKDSTAPKLHLTITANLPVTAAVPFVSNDTAIGVSSSTVHLVPANGGSAIGGRVSKTGTNAWKLQPNVKLVTGQTYLLSVSSSVHDAAGNPAVVIGAGVRTTTAADDGSRAWSYSGTWARHSSSAALGGTFRSSSAGHSATVKLVGSSVGVYVCRGPAFGKLSVLVDGSHKVTVDEHLSFTKCGVLVWRGGISSGATHTVKLVAASGTANFDQVRAG